MSASLVGSEMCIRDRFRELPGRGSAQGLARAPPALSEHSGPSEPLAAPCLLYTSDAADDM
eukprot:9627915-Alexandrium_andersonii.AAC.1